MRVLLGIISITGLLAGCGHGPRRFPDDLDEDLPRHADLTRDLYTLWWNGARIGDVEEERRSRGGELRLIRREHVQVMRGDRLAGSRLTITIDADAELRASEVTVDAVGDGGALASRAWRADDGRWRIALDGQDQRTADGDAVPAELVALLVARDGRFAGAVLLPGRGFAVAELTVEPDGDRHRAELVVPGGRLVTMLELDRDGSVLRAAGADGIVAVRASAADVAEPFDPPEVVDGTAIEVAGAMPDDAVVLRLAMSPVERDLPPPIPGQVIAADGNRWGLVLDPSLPGELPAGRGPADVDRTDDITTLVHTVDVRLDEDLAVTAPTMTAARRATAGDCTTHALLFAALAGDADIDIQLVTGFRLADGLLIRHRWAVAWTGAAWMAVDPTHGQAPVRSFLIGLAVHGALAEEVALADEVTFAGTGGARAKVQPVP